SNNAVFTGQGTYGCSTGTNGTTPFFVQETNGTAVAIIASASNSTTFYVVCTGY
ncbi:MAG: hypothetical protein JWO85_3578, partial [Candidatus Eremiobacteraeota bacterium]|nr:hypothetical protein [Candidatus Eremiobacteraeota bacterium]